MMQWEIYYGMREYACEVGDPLLGVVEAETKEQAEAIARKRGLGARLSTGRAGAGVWAAPHGASARRKEEGP